MMLWCRLMFFTSILNCTFCASYKLLQYLYTSIWRRFLGSGFLDDRRAMAACEEAFEGVQEYVEAVPY